jgi:F0F1-type ATP synthase membrane subunit b/b'
MRKYHVLKKILFISFVVLLTGCQSTYYSAMEKVGVHKRDILVDRVEEARDAQDKAQQQFKDALEQYRAVVQFNGGELETLYDRMSDEYDDSVDAAENVSDRIQSVERVAQALFDEWKEELPQYQNTGLRDQSAKQLKETEKRYAALMRVMTRAEKRMQPVLSALKDNVLYLKHNLNARAIGALKGELARFQRDIDKLVSEMQRSIKESDAFIRAMDAT